MGAAMPALTVINYRTPTDEMGWIEGKCFALVYVTGIEGKAPGEAYLGEKKG